MGGFPKLTILSEQLRGKTFELNKDLHTVGRIEERDICIMDPTISSYHCSFIKSGNTEGRIEKDFFGRVDTPWVQINNKVVRPGDDEVERNPRSRSAKLRIAEKTEPQKTQRES